jgi:hypothetical protein
MPETELPTGAAKREAERAAEAARKRRLSERLDEGLLETFPASDPVAVANVR